MIPRANSKAQTGSNNNRQAGSSSSGGTRTGSKSSPAKTNLASRMALLSLDADDKENAIPRSIRKLEEIKQDYCESRI
jgi:hypothetical protein